MIHCPNVGIIFKLITFCTCFLGVKAVFGKFTLYYMNILLFQQFFQERIQFFI